jgi:hypothetical protein
MAERFTVRIPAARGVIGMREMFGIPFMDGVATGVTDIGALSQFRTFGYEVISEEKPKEPKAKAVDAVADEVPFTDDAPPVEAPKVVKKTAKPKK